MQYNLDEAFSSRDYAIAHVYSAVHGVAHVSQDGAFIDCNQAYCDILGRSKGDIIGRKFQEFTLTDDLLEDQKNANDVAAGYIDSYCMDKHYTLPNGSTVYVQLEVRRCPWDVREKFRHYVVHCYLKERRGGGAGRKRTAVAVAIAGGCAGAFTGNADLVVRLIFALFGG